MGCCGDAVRSGTKAAKAALHLDAAPRATVENRRQVCRSCDQARPCTVGGGKCWCAECGCFLKLKTILITETCPLGKW